jgi:hypothetical protein
MRRAAQQARSACGLPAGASSRPEVKRQIAEYGENLCSSSLTASEKALFTRRRKEAYEALHPETKPTSEGGGGRNNATRRQLGEDIAERFTADTAERTGESERTVQRNAERGEKIDVKALDNACVSLPDHVSDRTARGVQLRPRCARRGRPGQRGLPVGRVNASQGVQQHCLRDALGREVPGAERLFPPSRVIFSHSTERVLHLQH